MLNYFRFQEFSKYILIFNTTIKFIYQISYLKMYENIFNNFLKNIFNMYTMKNW